MGDISERKFNSTDRYSIANYLRDQANFILNYSSAGDNGAQDLADRTLKELIIGGVSSELIKESICLFYRDNPEVIGQLNNNRDGADYLKGLESEC